jgi:hypothetical protein
MRSINPQPLKILDRCWAKQIVPDPCHHEYFRSAEPRRHCLVRAFSTEAQVKPVAKNRLSGLRESVRKRGEIDVGATNNRNSRTLGHDFYYRF